MGTGNRSTKDEAGCDTPSDVHASGRGNSGPLFGDQQRTTTVNAGKTAPKTGEELVIMPITLIEDKRDEAATTTKPENEQGRVLYRDDREFCWSIKKRRSLAR